MAVTETARARSAAGAAARGRAGAGGAVPRSGSGAGTGRSAGTSRPGASVALAIFTVCSAAALVRVFGGHSWVGPVVITVILVHLSCWALRAGRVPGGMAAVLVAAIGALSASWTVLGRYTFYGIPTAKTWNHATSALGTVSSDFATMVAPVAVTRGFELLALGGAAVAAALADWAAFRMRVALAGLVPGLAVFVFCCAAGATPHRGAVVGLEVAGACFYLLVERATSAGQFDWFAGIRPALNVGILVSGAILAAVAVVAAVALSPALAPRDGAGVLGFRNGIGPGGGERIVPNPLVDLQTRLTQQGNTPVFLASSSVPSYWRLTSLDTFNGVTWTSTGSYRGFGSKLPGSIPQSAGTRTVRASFTIQKLDSPWLPAQFTPISVQGVKRVTYDASSDSLLTAANTSNNLTYSVTSYQYLDTLTGAELAAAPPVGQDAADAGDLSLPSNVDPLVESLALSVTGSAPTEYGKAVALQNFLRSPLFTYTLTPKTDGSGVQALATFLFQTRQGYCQQFAGAYAVLARAVGLPTRLAVGFVTGTTAAAGQYQVYDRDAHTWPEVYFGPKFGWVPFEPTPGFSIPGASAYTQINANSGGGSGTSTATTTPTTTPATTPGSTSNVNRRIFEPTTLHSSVAGSSGHSGSGALWLLVVPGAALAWFAINGLIPLATRERRRRRAVAAGAAAVVGNEWDEVGRELVRHGLRRRPSETDDEYARRATAGLVHMAVIPERASWEHGGLAGLAALSRRATYGREVPPDLAGAAAAAAAEIRTRLVGSLSTRERVLRWSTPPPGALRALGRRLQA